MKKIIYALLLAVLTMTTATANPFFRKYNTPHQTPPFNEIKLEHYMPAFDEGIKQQQTEIDAIANATDEATFANTIAAYERSGELLGKVSSVFFNLLSAESDDKMLDLAQEISPKLSQHGNNISLNEKLFRRVKHVYDTRNQKGLTPEQIRLTEKVYEGFERSGATLSEADKETYRKLSAELSSLTLQFGQNVLKETNAYEMLLTNESDLDGLPQSVRDAAAAKAKSKGKEGWIFDLSAPSYLGFMKYAKNRELRKKLYTAFTSKGVQGGEFDNQENARKIAHVRLQIAKLMGYPDYASYALRTTMAKDKKNVFTLLDKLKVAYASAAKKDVADVKAFASKMEGKPVDLQPWDWGYYSEKLKDSKYSVSDEMVRPYFELENVKKGVFGLATDLLGLTFKKNTEIPVYHPEVDAYEVYDKNGNYIAVLYTDFHPREGKRQGAWMTSFQEQYVHGGENTRPHVSLVMNFTRPTGDKPALLTFDEVETFLHEFGHGLHGMLSNVTYETLSGTNVPRDFVELPSQLLENWLTEKEFLDRFAVHYQTGEKIPAELVNRLVSASNYNAGYDCYRQLQFGYLDMAWHTLTEPYEGDVREFEKNILDQVKLLPLAPTASISTAFNHIFAGGYAAGYYGYKWSEVLDADAFAEFKKNGIFDKATAEKFRKYVLERGGTEEPMELYKKFRGQEPSIDALLERSGVKKPAPKVVKTKKKKD